MTRTRFLSISTLIWLLAGTSLAASSNTDAYVEGDITDKAEPSLVMMAEEIRKRLRTGYVLIDIKTGAVLDAEQARETFIPASVAKIPSLIALTSLTDVTKRPKTRIIATGPVNKGVVRGNLVLVGSGDPMFDTPAAERIVSDLKKKGIKSISGSFLFYDGALPHHHAINAKQPADAPYNPGISGLSINFNRYRVAWRNGQAEGTEIPLRPLPVSSQLLESADTDRSREWLPVNNPGPFAAAIFRAVAEKNGIKMSAPERIDSIPDGTELASYLGDSLQTAISRAFHYSNNVAFEMMSLSVTGESNLEKSASVLLSKVKDVMPHVSWTNAELPNASGLSSDARMSPGQCAAMVRYMATTRVNGKLLSTLLPGLKLIPFGKPDELPESSSPLHAKTGTIYYGRALAGTIRADSGRLLAWCIMSDDQKERSLYDNMSVTEQRTEPVRNNAQAWLMAAKRTEAELVLTWKSKY